MDKNTIIREWLKSEGRTSKWLASAIGVTPEHLSRIINCKLAVGRTMALALENVSGGKIAASHWDAQL
jgi:plasmid maintenance system antidote protein VapI